MNKTRAAVLERIGELSHEDFVEVLNENDEMLAKTMQAEADLLNAFVEFTRKINSLKWILRPAMGMSYGSDEMDSMKDMMKSKIALEATRNKLRTIVAEKMPILHAIIEDVLGPTEKEKEAHAEMKPKEHEGHDHEDEDQDEDEDEDEY